LSVAQSVNIACVHWQTYLSQTRGVSNLYFVTATRRGNKDDKDNKHDKHDKHDKDDKHDKHKQQNKTR